MKRVAFIRGGVAIVGFRHDAAAKSGGGPRAMFRSEMLPMLQDLALASQTRHFFGPDRVLRVVVIDRQPKNVRGHFDVREEPGSTLDTA